MSEIIVKQLATIKQGSGDAKSGTFEVVLSTPAKDRDGDELLQSQWKTPLPEHITFDIDHGMSVATTIGSGVPYFDADGNLCVKGTFSSIDLGQQVRTLVNEGHIRTVSVAYMTETIINPDGSKSIVRELLNGAFVAIPANTEAIVLESKGLEVKDLEITKKSIIGSLEAKQERVSDAVEDAYPDCWTYVIGVIDNADNGVVVYRCYDKETFSECETYQENFSDDGSIVTLMGDRKAVDIFEVVVPDADEARDTQTDSATAVETAEKSAVDAADADEIENVEVFGRSLAIAAEALSN